MSRFVASALGGVVPTFEGGVNASAVALADRASVRPSAERLGDWLGSDAIVAPDGAILSWFNPEHPGYAYPEAAGLWLATIAGHEGAFGVDAALVDRVAARLADDVEAGATLAAHGGAGVRCGGVGRGDAVYLFDSAAALNGLVTHARARGAGEEAAMAALAAFVVRHVDARSALTPAAQAAERHWSLSFGSHQLKAVVGLHRYADSSGDGDARAAAAGLESELASLFDGSRFPVSAESDLTYLHGCLYAFEGLAFLDARQPGRHSETLRRGGEWLASIQDPSGGLRAWFDDGRPRGPLRTDATAQAARLWLMVDPNAFAPSIEGALAFLASVQTSSGALVYEPGSRDENTWASLFAAQALRWSTDGVEPDALT